MNPDEVAWIQIAFPHEPEWEALSDEVLVELVRQYVNEPSCASAALHHLYLRRHGETLDLADFILETNQFDRWLTSQALSLWMNLRPLEGFDRALTHVENCDIGLLEEIIVALNYEHQGPLSTAVHEHRIVQRVRQRLDALEEKSSFAELFFANFGQ